MIRKNVFSETNRFPHRFSQLEIRSIGQLAAFLLEGLFDRLAKYTHMHIIIDFPNIDFVEAFPSCFRSVVSACDVSLPPALVPCYYLRRRRAISRIRQPMLLQRALAFVAVSSSLSNVPLEMPTLMSLSSSIAINVPTAASVVG